MAYSAELAHRIGKILSAKVSFVEKKMFGGVAFMVKDAMCIGISPDKKTGHDRLLARVGPEFHAEALKLPGCAEMNFTGRVMKGFVFVHPEGYAADGRLKFWIDKALEFNGKTAKKPVKKEPARVKKKSVPRKAKVVKTAVRAKGK